MSTSPIRTDRPVELVAGLMASAAIAAGLVGIAYRPVRMTVPAIILSLIAAGIGGRYGRLAGAAVIITGVCWVLGMALAVITSNPIW